MEETLALGFLRHSSGGLRSSGSEAKEPSGLGGGPAPAWALLSPLQGERFGVGDPQRLSWLRPSGPLPLGVFSESVSAPRGARRGAPVCLA